MTATATVPTGRAAAPAARLGNVRRATFGDALRAETTKLRTVRSTWITLVIAAALAIGIGAAVAAVTASHYSSADLRERVTFDPTARSLAGFGLAQIAVVVLAILFVTSEYSTGMIRSTLTAVPRRGRVLAAKLTVFTIVAVVVGEVLAFPSFLIGQSLLKGSAPSVTLGDPNVLRAVVGTGLYLGVLSIIGLALGVIIRSTAGAIVSIVALLFVLPGIAQALPTSLQQTVTEYWPTQAGSQINNVVRDSHTLSAWAGFADMCVFAAIVVAIAATVLQRRDA